MLFCLTFVYNVAACRFIYSLLCQNIRGVSQTRYDYCPGHPCSRKYRAYRALVTANKALVGHFMPGTSVTWKPVPSSWVYFVNSYLKGDKMAKSCDYEAIRVFISVNVGKYTNNAITVNYSDSVCATRHYHSTKINSGGWYQKSTVAPPTKKVAGL